MFFILQLIERWRIILRIKITFCFESLAVEKEVTVYMGLKGSKQVIPFEAKHFSSFVGKSPSLVLGNWATLISTRHFPEQIILHRISPWQVISRCFFRKSTGKAYGIRCTKARKIIQGLQIGTQKSRRLNSSNHSSQKKKGFSLAGFVKRRGSHVFFLGQ